MVDAQEVLKSAITEVVGRSDFQFDGSTRLIEDIRLDSTSIMEVLMGVEDKSGIVINPDELDATDFETVEKFVAYINRNIPSPI